jgi:DNA recombination protein RmuC
VKAEFSKFGDVLDRVHRQLGAASNTIEQAGVRTRAMERRLRSVEQLTEQDATRVLELPAHVDDPEPDDAESEPASEQINRPLF